MSEKQIIEPIHTSCKNCIYAVYENNTQTDCSLKYIDKFRANNNQILEAYDEEKEFFVINNKKCIGYQTNEWFKSRKLDHLSLEEKISRYHDNNYIRYILWIDLKNFQSQKKLDLLKDELKKIQIKPAKIVFIRYKDISVKLHHFDNIKKILVESDMNDIQWRIQTTLVNDTLFEQQLYEATIHCKKRFIAIVTDTPYKLSSIIEQADRYVSHDMSSFSIISNEQESALIFPVSTYKYCLFVNKQELLKLKELYNYI